MCNLNYVEPHGRAAQYETAKKTEEIEYYAIEPCNGEIMHNRMQGDSRSLRTRQYGNAKSAAGA